MKFSVIVPVYNCIGDLPACVESILAQTCPDFELLLVDDGSTDGSGVLCDELAQKDGRIRVIHKENGGASSARNAGIRAAAGEYLLFIDGDDTLEAACLAAIPTDADMTVFGMAFDYADGRTDLLVYPEEVTMSSVQVSGHFEELFACNALSSACNKCFRGSLIRESGILFREGMTLYEDLDFVLRCLPHSKVISFLPRCFYHYRLKAQSGNLDRRTRDIHKLSENLRYLGTSMVSFGGNAEKVYFRLCAQLLYRHFLFVDYRVSQLQSAAEAFALPLKEDALQGNEKEMAAMLEARQYRRLHRWLAGKKLARRLRRSAKAVLQALGLK